MKMLKNLLISLLLVLPAMSSLLTAQALRTYTLKNSSDQTANDLHTEIYNGSGTAEPVSKAVSQAFNDPPQGMGSNTLDWPKAGGGGSVAPGATDKVGIENEDQDFLLITPPAKTYFTRDGHELKTTAVELTIDWTLDPDAWCSYTNPLGQGTITVVSVQIYKNNDLSNFTIEENSFPYHTPTGILVHGASNVIMNEGDSVHVSLGAVDLNTYQLALATVVLQSNPFDTFFVASGYRPPSPPIPTLSEWGMIVFVVLLAGWMTFVVVRRWKASQAAEA
jgi:hypothetical protein